jgi:hypothetical protein
MLFYSYNYQKFVKLNKIDAVPYPYDFDEAKICLKNTLIPAFSEFFIFFLCKVICKTNLESKINFLD